MRKIIGDIGNLAGIAVASFIAVSGARFGYDYYQQSSASAEPDTLQLCRDFKYTSILSTLLCERHTLPDGRYAIVEFDNDITPILLDTVIKLRQNQAEPIKPVPAEEIDPNYIYNFMG